MTTSEYYNSKLSKIGNELKLISQELYLTFLNNKNDLRKYFDEKTLVDWALIGLNISKGSEKNLKTGKKFFQVSSLINEKIPLSTFKIWMLMVEKISLESTALGYSYLISSPSVLKFLRPRYLQEWGEISKSIFSGSWKSNSLASKFLELSPLLLEIISFDDLKKISEYCKNLSVKSCDLASHNLDWFSENLPILAKESGDFIILLKKNDYL